MVFFILFDLFLPLKLCLVSQIPWYFPLIFRRLSQPPSALDVNPVWLKEFDEKPHLIAICSRIVNQMRSMCCP